MRFASPSTDHPYLLVLFLIAALFLFAFLMLFYFIDGAGTQPLHPGEQRTPEAQRSPTSAAAQPRVCGEHDLYRKRLWRKPTPSTAPRMPSSRRAGPTINRRVLAELQPIYFGSRCIRPGVRIMSPRAQVPQCQGNLTFDDPTSRPSRKELQRVARCEQGGPGAAQRLGIQRTGIIAQIGVLGCALLTLIAPLFVFRPWST